jgi:HSP20 family protein
MAPSPFHGIFSAFQATQQNHDLLPNGVEQNSGQGQGQGQGHVGQITVDIYEVDDYYIIRAPIAGVKLSDLDIEVDDKIITIRGVRRLADPVSTERYYLQECFWGEFRRSVTLPMSIDPRKVKATFSKDCILKILIPKEEKIKIVRISEV